MNEGNMATTATMLLVVAIAIAVLLYIVVQRLDRIIALQLLQQDYQKEHYWRLGEIMGLAYGEELGRRVKAANQAESEKMIADFKARSARLRTERDTDAT